MTTTDRTSQTMTLPDGRRLGFAEYGPPDGKPLFMFAGTNGRFLRPSDDDALLSHMIRLITVERPGLGLSDPQPGRRLLDWPDDVVALADHLGLGKFAVMGLSQGGPYAAACAYKLPDRLVAATLVSALAPFTVPGLNKENTFFLKLQPFLGNHAPFLLDAMFAMIAPMARRDPERFVRQMLNNLPPSDQAALSAPATMALFVKDIPEAFRQGGKGGAGDVKIVTRPWGFRPEDIKTKVFLWQGENDPNVTPAMGRYLANAIPGCEATFVPGAGHFLAYSQWSQILAQLSDYWQTAYPSQTGASA